MIDLLFFAIFAAVAVLCALNVVLQTHPISSALSLVGVMASLAVLYLLLGGEFIAMAQIIVYAGAVMVLFVFVIMLLNAGIEVRRGRSWTAQIFGIPALIGLMGALAIFFARWMPDSPVVKFGDFTGGTAKDIGMALFTTYLLPFEVTSVLILIAIVGAVVLARKGARLMPPIPNGVPEAAYLALSAIIFVIGVAGFVFRRNIITVFMCIELMLNAVNLSFVTFANHYKQVSGHIFTFFVMVVAAAEAAVGLAIILTVFKNRTTLNIDEVDSLKN